MTLQSCKDYTPGKGLVHHIGPLVIIDIQPINDNGMPDEDGYTHCVTRKCEACGKSWTFDTEEPDSWPVGYRTEDTTIE